MFDYGRYTPYVLTSYGIAAAVIIGLIVWSVVRVTNAKKKLEEASSTIEAAEVRTRAMSSQLRSVESMPTREAQGLLGMAANEDDEQGLE